MAFDLEARLEWCRDETERYLDRVLAPADSFPRPLFESMRYSLFAGGKRVRPAFACAAAEALGGDPARAVPFAAAIEMVHTYSLIHDDLPAMDDDDLRRGKPTNHVLYGDGLAVLAGDGLLTDAFAVLTNPALLSEYPAHVLLRIAFEVAKGAGTLGMVAGQALDLASEGKEVDLPTLEFLHVHKTGALIRASVLAGALAAGAAEPQLKAVSRYAERVGLAFQVADDVLNVEGSAVALGKPVGSDAVLSKATYPALLGLAESKRRAAELVEEALAQLAPFGAKGEWLAALARFVVERRH